MPDQFGNPTPQEVLAQIGGENNSVIAGAQTPAARRNAMLYALGRNMTASQDPRMVQAQVINDAVGKSLAINREEGESALDFEIRKGRDLYSRLTDVDHTAALQVAKQVLMLEEERSQQARLKEQDTRAQEMHAAQMDSYKRDLAVDNAEGIRYAYDPKTQSSVPGLWTHIQDLAGSLKDQTDWQARGLIPVTRDELFRLSGQAGDAEAHKGILNNSGIQSMLTTASDYVGQALLGKQVISGMADALEAGANPSTGAERFAVAAQGLLNSFDETRRSLHMDKATGLVDPNFRPAPRPGSKEFDEDVRKVQQALNDRNIKTSLPASFLTLYIYSVAKAQDARVTNMDFENIASTLRSVAGDPTQISKIMLGQTDLTRQGLALTSRELATRWTTEHPKGTEAYQDGDLILGVLNNGDSVLEEMKQEAARLEAAWKAIQGAGAGRGRARVVGENR